VFFRKTRRKVAEEVRSRLGFDGIVAMDDMANCFGVESAGMAQIRGNGCLAATDEEILFLMWVPRKELRIPRGQVTAVERTRSHLGKTIFRDLLRVRFVNDAGQPDSVAWYVRNLPEWDAALSA
jgi:hypothetical protein